MIEIRIFPETENINNMIVSIREYSDTLTNDIDSLE